MLRAALTGRNADGSTLAAEVEEQEDGRSGVHASPRRPRFSSKPPSPIPAAQVAFFAKAWAFLRSSGVGSSLGGGGGMTTPLGTN